MQDKALTDQPQNERSTKKEFVKLNSGVVLQKSGSQHFVQEDIQLFPNQFDLPEKEVNESKENALINIWNSFF